MGERELTNKSQLPNSSKQHETGDTIRAVDLFCGAGGLTQGLVDAGINVTLGIDVDPACEYPYTANNNACFSLMPVEDLSAASLHSAFEGAQFKLLAGCAPCQPFSTYSQRWSSPSDERWNLLDHFSRLVRETQPHLVTMENVPRLKREKVFSNFVATLEDEKYEIFCDIVNSADYGVPQDRRRLVLIASKLGPIDFINPTTPKGHRKTVRMAIEDLPVLKAGETCAADPLHQSSRLSSLNLKRIRASVPGGTWRDWGEDLRTNCHRRLSGKTYPSVYGRMSWDEPSPTMTTQFYGFGNGRFGHPDQDRGISLREGAILQSFPKSYKFVPEGESIHRKSIGRLIGNAVPVELGKAIGRSIVHHVESCQDSHERAS